LPPPLVFDREARVDNRIIKLSFGLQGTGRIGWLGANGRRVATFDPPPDTALDLIRSTSSPSTSTKPIAAAIDALSVGLGPAISDALADVSDPRLKVAGIVGFLPVMATRVDSVPIVDLPRFDGHFC